MDEGRGTAAAPAPGAARDMPAGVGIGWRAEIDGTVRALPGLRWCEVVAESVRPGALPPGLAGLLAAGVTVVPHGVRVNLGDAGGPDPAALEAFAAVVDAVQAPLASEHIAFVGTDGVDVGHLLPLPRTREAVDVVVAGARAFASAVGVPVALEPIATLFDWPGAELTEGQFVTEICERADCLLLLDVANVHANALNRGEDPLEVLAGLPLERIAYVHVAGGSEHDGLYHDTHTDPVPPEVLALLGELCGRAPVPAAMLERDGRFPPAAELAAELDAIADAARMPRVTRG